MDANAEANMSGEEDEKILNPKGRIMFSLLAFALGAACEMWRQRSLPHYPHYPWDRVRIGPSWLNDFYSFELSHPRLIALSAVVLLPILMLVRRQTTRERLVVLFLIGVAAASIFLDP
jgi:hypothetical protein